MKLTKEKFNEIKEFLNTPILVKPSIRYVARQFGYSSSTIAKINRFDKYDAYKAYEKERSKQYYKDYIENDLRQIKAEGAIAKKKFEEFNNEWFFQNESKPLVEQTKLASRR